MYVRVLQDELQFPDDRAMDQDTKGLIRGVSCRISMFNFEVTNRRSFYNAILHSASANRE